MTSSSEEEEADVPRAVISALLAHYLKRVLHELPPFTGQIIVLFCLVPVATSISLFLLTAILNFGIAFIAQAISSVVVLFFLVPCLAVSFFFAVATAYVLQMAQTLYLKVCHVENVKKVKFTAEVEDKLKLL